MWVFAYGSLLWDPGFEVAEEIRADLNGYIRSFCMRSVRYRGTDENPGLVLALDAGEGFCAGMALRVEEEKAAQVLDYLRERELISSAYNEAWLDIDLADGRTVNAVTYVINREHDQYCAEKLEDQPMIIANAEGSRGPNPEYLFKTANLLHDLNIADPDLDWLSQKVQEILKLQ